MELSIKVMSGKHQIIAEKSGMEEVNLLFTDEYQEGDFILLETTEKNTYLWLQFDDALGRSLVFITGPVAYQIPFGEKRLNLSSKAFCGSKHLLYARAAREYEIKAYRNLALNVYDQQEAITCYPHATANAQTRSETVFAAKNAIDGITANESHGEWPYQSWGINRQQDAVLRIDFGRSVAADRIVLYTRADFPHDNWWKMATFVFSDGSTLKVEMEKKRLPHEFTFERKKINWVEIGNLIKSEEESPYPALTQMEVYGFDAV